MAAKHYLQVTGDHFCRATPSGAESGARSAEDRGEVVQLPVPQPAAQTRMDSLETKKARTNRAVLLPNALACDSMLGNQVPPRGVEHGTKTSDKRVVSEGQRAKNSAVGAELLSTHPELRLIFERWHDLPDAVRTCILKMIQQS